MPLVRFQVKNEYGLGDPQLYREESKRENPKAILDGVAVAGLVGILRQLGDLAEFAADVFRDLHEEVMTTAARGRKILTRVQRIESALPSLEKAVQCPRSCIHFAYIAGLDWHSNVHAGQNQLLCSDLPQFMIDCYEECQEPPPLHSLDKFDNSGPGACLRRYSDPSYFRRALSSSETGKTTKAKRKKKRKGSRLRNSRFQHVVFTPRDSNSTQFASPNTDQLSFSVEDASFSETRFMSELSRESVDFGLQNRSNCVEQILDSPSSIPVVPDYDRLSESKSNSNHNGDSAINLHDESNEYCIDDDSQPSLQQQSAPSSSSVKWDQKTEIEKSTSPKLCEDELTDAVQDLEFLPQKSEASKFGHDTARLGTVSKEDIVFELAKVPVSVPGGNLSVPSETDNFMDANHTLEPEINTDYDCQTKGKFKSHSNFTRGNLEPESYGLNETNAIDSLHFEEQAPIAFYNSLNNHTSQSFPDHNRSMQSIFRSPTPDSSVKDSNQYISVMNGSELHDRELFSESSTADKDVLLGGTTDEISRSKDCPGTGINESEICNKELFSELSIAKEEAILDDATIDETTRTQYCPDTDINCSNFCYRDLFSELSNEEVELVDKTIDQTFISQDCPDIELESSGLLAGELVSELNVGNEEACLVHSSGTTDATVRSHDFLDTEINDPELQNGKLIPESGIVNEEVELIERTSDETSVSQGFTDTEIVGLERDQELFSESSISNKQAVLVGRTNDETSKPPVLFWTNGGILGLEPSKPPDLGINGMSEAVDKCNGMEERGRLHGDLHVKNSKESTQSPSLRDLGRSQVALSSTTHIYKNGTDGRKSDDNVGSDLTAITNNESHSNGSDQDLMGNMTSISGLAQKFLSNSLQRRILVAHAGISKPSQLVNNDFRKLREILLQNDPKEQPGVVLSNSLCGPEMKENNDVGTSAKPISLSSLYSGSSSPPLECMKISFHPMNDFETSKLKLEFSSGNFHDGVGNKMFPSFQLIPGPTTSTQVNDSESDDDDTFCHSSAYSSDDLLSPHSSSNSEVWGEDETSEKRKVSGNSCRISSPMTSICSSIKFDQMDMCNIAASEFEHLEIENGRTIFQSDNVEDLLVDSEVYVRNQLQEVSETLEPIHIGSTLSSQYELPPPPLPPLQWRVVKQFSASVEDENSTCLEPVEHLDAETRCFTTQKQQEDDIPMPLHCPGAVTHLSKIMRDQEKPPGYTGWDLNYDNEQQNGREACYIKLEASPSI